MLVISRFLDHDAMREFILKFAQVATSTMCDLEVENADADQNMAKTSESVPKKTQWPPDNTFGPTSDQQAKTAEFLIRRHRIVEALK